MSPQQQLPAKSVNRTKVDAVPPDEKDLAADYRLAQRCAAGEVAAWEELYAQCHDRLLSSINSMLAGHGHDTSLGDEIAARVWYSLVDNDGKRLLSYDPDRGARLITFMREIAKDLLRRHFRSERRRQGREAIATEERPYQHEAEFDRNDSTMDEFLATLSPSEQSFCHQYLLNAPADGGVASLGYSQANVWQKTRRLYKRLLEFLGKEASGNGVKE